MALFEPSLQPGDPAPPFELQDEDGVVRRLEDYRGRWLVLFFYPKDHTPGCMREAARFGEWQDRFSSLGAEILGVSGDDAASHRRFRSGARLRYHLLSDPGRTARDAWGVPRAFGFEGRSTFVVDPQGVVRFSVNSGGVARFLLRSTDEAVAERHPADCLAFLESAASSRNGAS